MQWINTNNNCTKPTTIIAISDEGYIMRKSGVIEHSKYMHRLCFNNKLVSIHQVIAENFLPKTEEDIALGRNQIDHITHNPVGMNVNDVRNLRWCTQKENCNFDECKLNHSIKSKDKPRSEFGKLYIDKYGYSNNIDHAQYLREYRYFKKFGILKE